MKDAESSEENEVGKSTRVSYDCIKVAQEKKVICFEETDVLKAL